MVHEAVRTDLPSVGLPFSWGVRWGDLVFVAGQGPLDRDGKVIEGDIRTQTQRTLENFRRVVEAAGSRMDRVLSTTVYLRDLEDFAAMNEVYAAFFDKEPRPARATVRADLLFGMKVEVQGIAYRRESRAASQRFQPRSTMPSGMTKKRKKSAKKKAYYAGRKERKARK